MRVLELVERHWLLYLGVAAAWATFFSFFNRQPLRGLRNFGILGAYVVGVVMAFRLPWRQSTATWACFAIVAGVLYSLYELITYLGSSDRDAKPRLSTLLNGFVAWPIMLPEVIEYTLGGVGLLKAPTVPVGSAAKGGGGENDV